MKTNLFSLLLLFCSITLHAQNNENSNYTYRPLAEFGTDTLRFLRVNFQNQSDYFKGKTIGEVLEYYRKDLPINFISSVSTGPFADPKGIDRTKAISIYHYDYVYFCSTIESRTPIIAFYIYLLPPYPNDYLLWFDMPEYETAEEEADYLRHLKVDHIDVWLSR